MYYAKRIGGDRIEVFKPAMRSRKTDRLTMESELRRAIEREEISILYQPIVRLEDRAVAGFEALARWDHPKMGRLPPAEFISMAEEIGLIVDLGLFVLDRSARQLATWQRSSKVREPIFTSVNISSRQLLRQDLIHDLRTVLARNNLERGTLKLELTESLVMENPEHAAQMLGRIRDLGAGLALGYAGWEPGQLENEIQQNGWLHCAADKDLIFGTDIEAKYNRALQKIGIDLAMLSNEAGHA
jgi:predicted signal transduction protein with EAL and GGDEF domain